ncbi:MAG: hypothetical protein NTX81_01640 [Candidatus Bathyarchaeota archaeon]|nr:hypothetical protein [Candidatus Bathyarchaeota archaeon]
MADWINKSKILDRIREECSGLLPEKNIEHVYRCIIVLALFYNDATLPIDNAYGLVYYWGLLPILTDIVENHRDHNDLLIREDL